MLIERQKLLLALVDALGGHVSQTDFQKHLLLYTREWEAAPSYEFVPYHFGGFSFTSYADKRRLIEKGFLAEDENRWSLSESGRDAIRPARSLRERTSRFAKKYGALSGDPLIAETYRRFPFLATRSKIAERVLSSEERAAVERARPTAQPPALLTIGYEGKSLEAYLDQLLRESVTILCDVRRNPLSRKYGFSKKTLSHACEQIGIRYEHLPELGIASEERKDLKTQADYDALFDIYERDTLPNETAALAKIRAWIHDENHRVAITCYEALPCQCHRHCVAEALEKDRKRKLFVSHL